MTAGKAGIKGGFGTGVMSERPTAPITSDERQLWEGRRWKT